jgi:hypothetical protein
LECYSRRGRQLTEHVIKFGLAENSGVHTCLDEVYFLPLVIMEPPCLVVAGDDQACSIEAQPSIISSTLNLCFRIVLNKRAIRKAA